MCIDQRLHYITPSHQKNILDELRYSSIYDNYMLLRVERMPVENNFHVKAS
jgi:hypothetical protein